jgi:MFS family permease
MNGLQTLPQWREFFGNPEGALLGLMNSVYPLGKVVSLFAVSYICDRWGRKLPILIGLVTCIGFATLQGLSQNLHSFIIARAFLGFFTSFIGQPSPIIITELAYPTQRGKVTALYNTFFVSLNSVFLCIVILITYVVLVLWLYFRCLVYLRHLQEPNNLELANSISSTRCITCHATFGRLLPARISQV